MNPPYHKNKNIMENIEITIENEALELIKEIQSNQGYNREARAENALTAISKMISFLMITEPREKEAFFSVVSVIGEYSELLRNISYIQIEER